MCSDRDLHAIAAAQPVTAEDLAAVTSLGPLTAARLLPGVLDALSSLTPR